MHFLSYFFSGRKPILQGGIRQGKPLGKWQKIEAIGLTFIFVQTICFTSPMLAMEPEIYANPSGKENPSEKEIKKGLTIILDHETAERYYNVNSESFLGLDDFIDLLVARLDDLGIKAGPETVAKVLKSIEGNEKFKLAYARWSATNQVRERYRKIRAATQDLLHAHLFTAGHFFWKDVIDKNTENVVFENDTENARIRAIQQNGITIKSAGQLHERSLESYGVEVHYIKVLSSQPKFERVKMDKIDIHKHSTNFSFEFRDPKINPPIISLVAFKPRNITNKKVPVVIFNHGGEATKFFTPTGKNPMLLAFAGLGYAIICPNYRGGSAENHEADMTAVIEYLKQQDYIDSTKIVLAGISSGTTLNAQILNKPVAKELAGVFLHTGLYQDRLIPNDIANSRGLLDAIKGVRKDLPIFLASGANDPECHIISTLNYIRALQDSLDNFKYSILNHGGHHLIEKITDKVSEINVGNKSWIDHKALVNQIKNSFNTDEVEQYAYSLVEFLDEIGHGPIQPVKRSDWKAEYIPKAFEAKGADIVKKARVALRIKEGSQLSFGPTILELDEKLKQADYAPSLAQLKILLANQYDPHSLETTIDRFLEKFDSEISAILLESVKDDPAPSSVPQYEKTTENDQLKQLILNILKNEVAYKGSFPLYHAASSQVGFIYDVYSSIRRLLLIQGNMLRVRLLDDAFLKILSADDLIDTMRRKEPLNPQVGFNYLPGYSDVGISAQFFLFGAYKYWRSSTFFNFFLQNASIKPPSLERIFELFFKAMGIDDAEKLKNVVVKYRDMYLAHSVHANSPLSGGRQLQIFVSPSIFNKTTYLSEMLGYPLELQLTNSSAATHEPFDAISLALTSPDEFMGILIGNRGNFKLQQPYKSRSDFFKIDENLLSCVEARFFMKPEYMDDPRKVQIFDYHVRTPSDEAVKSYKKALDVLVDETLALLLDHAIQPELSMIHHEPALLKLKKYVDQGNKEFFLLALLSEGNFTLEQYLEKHPKDVNISIDLHGHTLLYKLLDDHKFEAAQFLMEHGADVKARNRKGQSIEEELWHHEKYEAFIFLNHKIDIAGDINAQDKEGNTPLLLASQYGLINIVKNLLDKSKDYLDRDNLLNHRNQHGFSALHQAILGKHADIALLLIAAFVKLDTENEDDDNPLVLAKQSGLKEVVRALEERTLLMAIEEGNEEKALMLIESGINPAVKNKDELSALMIAVSKGSINIINAIIKKAHPQALKSLLNYAIIIDKKPWSVLDRAISKDFPDIALMLIKAGADVPESSMKYMEEQGANFAKAIETHKSRLGQLLLSALKNKDQNRALELIKEGADIRAADEEGNTSLIYASYFGYKDVFKAVIAIIKDSPDKSLVINHLNNRGFTALALACDSAHYDLAEILMQAGADLAMKYGEKRDHEIVPFFLLDGRLEGAEWLIDHGAEIYPTNGNGISLTIELLASNNLKGLTFLNHKIYQRESVNSIYKDGNTPLLLALENNLDNAVLALLEHEENSPYKIQFINQENSAGESALYLALKNGKMCIAQSLIEAGADINLRDKFGCSLLYKFLSTDQFVAAKWLMEHGANVKATNLNGLSIADELLHNKHTEAYIFLNHKLDLTDNEDNEPLLILALMKDHYNGALDLIETGAADIHAKNKKDGATALHWAIAKKQANMALRLIEAGADINAGAGDDRITPLMLASFNGLLEVVKTILTKNPNALNEDANQFGHSLHGALKGKHADIALFLIKAGADVETKDKDGKTPLMLASEQGFHNVIYALQKALLFNAIRQKDQEKALHLIRDGADIDIKDNDGNTLFMLASSGDLTKVVKEIKRKTLLSALDEHEINLERAEEILQGNNLLVLIGMLKTALQFQDVKTIDKLLSQYYINEILLKEYSPLHVAVQLGSVEMVEMLLSKLESEALNPYYVHKHGHTPLHVAIEKRNVEMIKAMLSNPRVARILLDERYVKDRDGKTVYDMILEIEDRKVQSALVDAIPPQIWRHWERATLKWPQF